jgi:two-component sensor histidine kinase
MQWLVRLMGWQSKQPAILRWTMTFALFGAALATRYALGLFYGAIPSLAFYPVLLVVAALIGWKEALAVLALSVTVGIYFFLPPGMYLLPVGWVFVGSLTIAIITALKTLAQELAEANERQRLLFRELQHRVANTLQSVAGTLEMARRRIEPSPAEAGHILEEAIRRIMTSADVHRRLNDPKLFGRGLRAILNDAVQTVIDPQSTDISFDVDDIELSFDQMSVMTMIVLEIANNAQKHVFERNLGRHFLVALRALPDCRAMLSAKDDGPGWAGDSPERTQGLAILKGLADQLHAKLRINSQAGTEVCMIFPTQPVKVDR